MLNLDKLERGELPETEGHGKPVPVCDLTDRGGLPGAYEQLSELLATEPNPSAIYERDPSQVVKILRRCSPEIWQDLVELQSELDSGRGFFVLKGTGIDSLPPAEAQLAAIAFSSVFGKPTRTDLRKPELAWPVRYVPSGQNRKTFSQSMSEASFHTDTQYFLDRTEKYFGLFCVKADEPGKGTNQLVDGQAILDQMARDFPELAASLRKDYPFRVPSVFSQSGNDKSIELIWKPVVAPDGSIRYRHDTLLEGLALPGIDVTDSQREAIKVFEEYVSSSVPDEYHLKAGEAIFVNNHRLLHARTSYSNPDRLLYRVRVQSH